jgi:hypothetical protein
VIRLEDSMQPGFRSTSLAAFVQQIDVAIASALDDAEATGVELSEVQLDYDAPESQLTVWAHALHHFATHALAGRAVWVTSIPSHLRHSAYAAAISGVVQGHVIQLFDTGLHCTSENGRHLRRRLHEFGLAFRVGVGAFERRRHGAEITQHGCWMSAARALRDQPGFAGLWVFPAGHSIAQVAGSWGARP